MKLPRLDYELTLKELNTNYYDDEDRGCYAWNDILCIRPTYQRNYCYDEKRRNEVIDTLLDLGMDSLGRITFWKDDNYEVLDGQQRIISILEFLNNKFSIIYDGKESYFSSLPLNIQEEILSQTLDIRVGKGTLEEKLKWFKKINIGGLTLTNQELLNSSYGCAWLEHQKKLFSKTNCVAYQLASDYIKGNTIRQEWLEQVLEWYSDYLGIDSIESLMAQKMLVNDNFDDMWEYFQQVIEWIKYVFKDYYKEMKGLSWGLLYNKYHENTYNIIEIKKKIKDLMKNDEIQKKSGIFEYILSYEKLEKILNPRTFSESIKRTQFEKQKDLYNLCVPLEDDESVCAKCGKKIKYKECEADHIIAWSKGGRTELDNCQILCRDCNREKSNK